MQRRLILLATTALALAVFTVPALADDHDGEESSGAEAPDVALIPCETDAECEEHKMVCQDGYCAMGVPEPECTADTDCAETEHCVWGDCEEKGTYCMTDADCGEYQMCGQGMVMGSGSTGSASSVPSETDTDDGEASDAMMPEVPPTCSTDEDCDDETTCVDGFCEGGGDADPVDPSDPVDIEPVEPTEDWGRCTVDPDQVPEDATCAAVCEAFASCDSDDSISVSTDVETTPGGDGSSGSSGSADTPAADPDEGDPDDGEEGSPSAPTMGCESDSECTNEGEFCIDGICQRDAGGETHPEPPLEDMIAWCTTMCSYAVAIDAGVEELAALDQCLQDNADPDDACAAPTACEDTGETFGEVLDEAGVSDAMGGGMAEGSIDLGGGDDGRNTAGSGDGGEGAPAEDSDDGGDSGGCGTGHAPVLPWLALMIVGVATVLRRRQTA
ncbi:MAG: hypothetical protein QF464_05065 [Myxococcota bacterium]|jgi:hypothetical protein|nr:hypothetical protein [Myxococcota bacterium]